MSFGRPPNFSSFSVTPPDRGSFPLDHEGECKDVMTRYLKCMKENKSDNGKCRHLSKDYLSCRMQKGLMEKDDMKNLGFQEQFQNQSQSQNQNQSGSEASTTTTPSSSTITSTTQTRPGSKPDRIV